MPHIPEGVTFRNKGVATSFIFGVVYTHTHTHTHRHIYIYIVHEVEQCRLTGKWLHITIKFFGATLQFRVGFGIYFDSSRIGPVATARVVGFSFTKSTFYRIMRLFRTVITPRNDYLPLQDQRTFL